MSNIVKAAVAAIIASGVATQAQAEDIKFGLLLSFSDVYAALGEEIETGFRLGLDTFGADSGATFEIAREDSVAAAPVGGQDPQAGHAGRGGRYGGRR